MSPGWKERGTHPLWFSSSAAPWGTFVSISLCMLALIFAIVHIEAWIPSAEFFQYRPAEMFKTFCICWKMREGRRDILKVGNF